MPNIRINEENWQWLNSLKRPGESFNDVLERLRTGKIENQLDRAEDTEKLPEDLELPGTGQRLQQRRAAVARLYSYLQDHGSATKSELLELVDPDEVGYSNADSFWSNIVKTKKALEKLPGVESPGEGGRTWRYVEPDR